MREPCCGYLFEIQWSGQASPGQCHLSRDLLVVREPAMCRFGGDHSRQKESQEQMS